MTIEQLLNCSADQLEKMSDKELLEYFAPYLNVTRPDLAVKERSTSQKREVSQSLDSKMALAKSLVSQFGIDFDDL